MATQKKLTTTAVRKAAAIWDREPGRGGFRNSIHYDIIIDGKPYPPKAIASYANELVGNGRLLPSEFAGAREGLWHKALRGLGYEIVEKGADAIALRSSYGQTILEYRDDPRFAECPAAFLVTGIADPRMDAINRELLARNQTGHWEIRDGRISVGDALFLLLPSLAGKGGDPRELFGGVVSAEPTPSSAHEGRKLISVRLFHPLREIESQISRYLGGTPPPRGNRAMEVWNDAAAEAKQPAAPGMDETADEESYPEGARKFRVHIGRERDRKLVARAKALRLGKTGKLVCEACDFNFLESYGPRGQGYIEAHHTRPVADNEGEVQVSVADLALVCANCHRMLHRMKPLITIEELRSLWLEQSARR